MPRPDCSVQNIGFKNYTEVFDLQEKLREELLTDAIPNTILICEHPPTFTVGKQDVAEDWLSHNDAIKKDGIEIVKCNRGGRITYHGPGQMVVYFIVKIADYSEGVKDFVSKIEDICIRTISSFGLNAERKSEHPGVWVNNKKIVAIGLNISRGVSIHGIAINVDPELAHYRHIVPCGIREFGVTSLAKELNRKVSMEEVQQAFLKSLEKIFGGSFDSLCSLRMTKGVLSQPRK